MPSCVIAEFRSSAELNRRNTSFVGDAQVNRPKPDGQGQVGAVHNRAGGDGSLMPAGATLAHFAPANRVIFGTAAFWADEAVGKPLAEQFLPAGILGIVAGAKFLETDLSRFCHDNIPRLLSEDIVAYEVSNKTDKFYILCLAYLSR